MYNALDLLDIHDFEQVVFCNDRPSGLRSIVAIHSTVLGPALGGTRFYPYADDREALTDVLRLASGMTSKAAAAGLDLGGGKAVIIGDPATLKTEALLRAHGRFIESLGGRYITAEDVGTTQRDMDMIQRETAHVVGVSSLGGGSGDPSTATATGLVHAMRAVATELWGTLTLEGRHVVISGVGKVGSALAGLLVNEQALVTIADVTPTTLVRVADDLGLATVSVERALTLECDIFAPCGMGGVLNESTIAALRCRAVVGSANNQLSDRSGADQLAKKGVLYVPDYIVNAGGLLNVAEELHGYRRARAQDAISRVFDTTARVLAMAIAESITPLDAADRLAVDRIAALSALPRLTARPG